MKLLNHPGARGWVEKILAGVLLAAATLKGIQLFHGAPHALIGIGPLPVALLIQAELLLALWLVTGGWPRVRFVLAIACFSIFAVAASYEAFRAMPSCGCFGNVKVPPALTAGFDLLSVLALAATRPRGAFPGPAPIAKRRFLTGVTAAVVCSAIFWSFYLSKARSANATSPPGSLVVLEPESWIGKPFPLFDEIEGSEPLRHGRWLVVFYHYDCDACREAIPRYLALAAQSHGDSSQPRIAFIAMPPAAPEGEDLVSASQSSRYLRLSLRQDHDWFATTPVVAAVEDDVVLAATDGEKGVQPPNLPQWGR